MRSILISTLLVFGLLFAAQALAADLTPVGTWTQVDDATHKPKSIIEITAQPDGTLQGVVKQVYFSDQGTTHPICDKCEGERHNQPVVGMVIMWDVKKDGDNEWSGGQILDPAKGKTYKVKLSLSKDGRMLDVRGYIGMPMLGRTQTWVRRSEPAPTPEPATMGPDTSAMPASATSKDTSTPEPSPATTSGSSSH